ncbi:hypothetical protein NQ318_006578 [Aromia moschata]|uniref:RNA helicase n=1 Tax=Aromia moschata TaxID=1265417 RepID=A0AAV8YQD5_9CUCU|nr:hypothetical protein NQ318_006578 [Aromia moschata]
MKDRHGVELRISPKQINGYRYDFSADAQRGEHCLKITPNLLLLHKKTLKFFCTVKNIRNEDKILITSALLLHPYSLYTMEDPNNNLTNGRYPELEAGAEYTVVVKFSMKKIAIGTYNIPVGFTFQTTGDVVDSFSFSRAIVVSVEEHIVGDEDNGESPFKNREWPRTVGRISSDPAAGSTVVPRLYTSLYTHAEVSRLICQQNLGASIPEQSRKIAAKDSGPFEALLPTSTQAIGRDLVLVPAPVTVPVPAAVPVFLMGPCLFSYLFLFLLRNLFSYPFLFRDLFLLPYLFLFPYLFLYNETFCRQEMEPGYVTAFNYRAFWHNVLWFEEMGQILMLQRYNMENVKMVRNGNMLSLEVPGLAEKRPSVIVGDMIDIRVHDDHTAYRGVIRRVNDKTVDIAYLDKELMEFIQGNPTIELDVRFIMGRLPLERMHQAVDRTFVNQMVPCLFPNEDLVRRRVPQPFTILDPEFFNRKITTNREQKTAVVKILNDTAMGYPYIVFGPPGTGKTVTIVEAILQIKSKTKKNILVCAPANAACDMLTEKLMMHCSRGRAGQDYVGDGRPPLCSRRNINPHIVEYTNYMQEGAYRKIDNLKQYRIVVTTLILIGRYSGRYHPDVVFVDEAAQACEPEVLCAIGMLERGKQFVLAGDPRQLGPSTASKVARKYGLEKSLLERLMDRDLYQTGNSNFITMLKLNFRSHSTILKLPNELFYDNQLLAMSATSENDPISKIFVYEKIQELLATRRKAGAAPARLGQAIEFCSIISKECRHGHSPSYYNVKEMQMVLKYIQALTQIELDEEDKVLPAHIGVVTPYIKQVRFILLRSCVTLPI